MSDLSYVGVPTPLLDGPAKITGNLKYTGDLKLAGMLHARFVLSTYAHPISAASIPRPRWPCQACSACSRPTTCPIWRRHRAPSSCSRATVSFSSGSPSRWSWPIHRPPLLMAPNWSMSIMSRSKP